MPNWSIDAEPMDGDGVEEVMWEYFTEVGRRVLGRPPTDAEVRAVLAEDPHDDLAPPDGLFLVARDGDGEFLGCAGLRRIPELPGAVELKRVYVRPAGRGAGLGRGLLLSAEEWATKLGASRIVCETNTELAEARTLYLRLGYAETAPYEGHGKADHWYAKDLG